MASNGNTVAAAWGPSDPTLYSRRNEVFTMTVDPNGQRLQPSRTPLRLSGNIPAIASDGDGYLVVAGGLGLTMGARLDAEGNVFDLQGFTIHPATRVSCCFPGDNGHTFRDVAWDGQRYVVASTREVFDPMMRISRAVIASTVTPDGHVLQQEILVADQASDGVVAARNGVSLFAWPTLNGFSTRTLRGTDELSPSVTVTFPSLPGSTLLPTLSAIATDDGFIVLLNDGSVRFQQFDLQGAPVGLPTTLAAGPVQGRVAATVLP